MSSSYCSRCPRVRAQARRLTSLEPSALLQLFPEIFQSHSLGLSGVRLRIYTPLVTLALSVWQFLWGASTCREAVVYLVSLRAAQKLPSISVSTGAFCRAKERLPLATIDALTDRVAAAAVKGVSNNGLWCGHHVKLLDGTTFSLPDTEPNQGAWPQPPTQKLNQGFPQLRVVALFCMATGVVLGRALGSYRQGEPSLFRQLFPLLKPGDVVVRDRAFAGFALMAHLYQEHVQTVTRLLPTVTRFRNIHGFARGDRLVRLYRPARRPKNMTKEEYDNLPKSLIVRIVNVGVKHSGFRTRRYKLLTTLIDHKRYSAKDLAELYARRWEVEVDIFHIKITMGAEMLRSRTPQMARRELAIMMLAYNIVRAVMVRAGNSGAIDPMRISFSAAIATIRQLNAVMGRHGRRSALTIIAAVLEALGKMSVPQRPGRSEPRSIKRRFKNYPRLRGARRQTKDTPHASRQYARAKRQKQKAMT